MTQGRSGAVALAFDTSSSVGSVAVARAGDVCAEVELTERGRHAPGLIPAIEAALEAADVGRVDVDRIVVGEGPGSFTGVRVAAATAKGLARALERPLFAVSSLAAAALGRPPDDPTPVRYVLFDARGDRVYGACHRVGPERVETLVAPHGGTLGELLAGDVPPGAVFAGDGAERHRAEIEQAGHRVAGPPLGRPSARGLIRYLELEPAAAPVAELAGWEPRYVRASSAEREWKR